MKKIKSQLNEKRKLLLAVCLLYALNSISQSISGLHQITDSLNKSEHFLNTSIGSIKKFARQDSLLSFKRIKIRSAVTAETRYYGLNYENTSLPKSTTTYHFTNKVDLVGIPFQLDAFLGKNVSIPGRGISRIQFRFDAATFASQLAKSALQQEQKKQLQQLQHDSDFINYMKSIQMVENYQNLLSQRSYLNQMQTQKNLVKQYESIGDSAVLQKPIYLNAKQNVDQYNKTIKDLDSLKKYLAYLDKINPMWKQLQDTLATISKPIAMPNQEQCIRQIESSRLIPAPLRLLSHLRTLEAGMVFPDFQPLIFKGAPLKGILVAAQTKSIFADAAFGKLFSPADFFRDSFLSSKVYAMAFRAGIELKNIRISYTLLQTHRINTTDTFAFRYYFESPKESTLHGLSLEWAKANHKFFMHGAKSDNPVSSNPANFETPRANDINRLLPGSGITLATTSAFQMGYVLSLNKTASEITLKYNYQGQYYFSPMRVFTQPPGTQYEVILKQSMLRKQLSLKLGATLKQSQFQSGYFSYNDKTYSCNFQLNLNLKKLPTLSISYLPYYRTSIYQNQEVLLKMEQLTASAAYSYQKRNNFFSVLGSFSRNKVVNIYSGIYEQAMVYATYKNISSPLGYNLILGYFSKPMASADSAVTYDIKGMLEYQFSRRFSRRFSLHVGGGYAKSLERSRYYPYFDMSWNNLYLGQIKLRADYTWMSELGIYKQGMTLIASITRTIF